MTIFYAFRLAGEPTGSFADVNGDLGKWNWRFLLLMKVRLNSMYEWVFRHIGYTWNISRNRTKDNNQEDSAFPRLTFKLI